MKDKDIFICRCEEVTLSEIEQAIDEGFITVNDVKRRTRAGMGALSGKNLWEKNCSDYFQEDWNTT